LDDGNQAPTQMSGSPLGDNAQHSVQAVNQPGDTNNQSALAINAPGETNTQQSMMAANSGEGAKASDNGSDYPSSSSVSKFLNSIGEQGEASKGAADGNSIGSSVDTEAVYDNVWSNGAKDLAKFVWDGIKSVPTTIKKTEDSISKAAGKAYDAVTNTSGSSGSDSPASPPATAPSPAPTSSSQAGSTGYNSLPPDQIANLTIDQINNLPADQLKLTPAQMNELTSAQIQAFRARAAALVVAPRSH
jgi:hypothetical protein